jgi:large subunit ribosomal protein L10
MKDAFQGTTAVTVSDDDPVTPAKILTKFAEAHPELIIKMGCLDGKALSLDDLLALAKLPSKEIMLGQLAAVLNAVPTKLVRTLNAIPSNLVYALSAVKDQKEQ